jgi:hypothetical protein
MNERVRKVVSMDEQELWLLSARDLRCCYAIYASMTIASSPPVPLIDGRSVWQQHSSLQRHSGV